MLHLLDSGVLINAHKFYYPIHRVPEFWEWLAYLGKSGQVKLPIEFYEEIKDGKKDELAKWIKNANNRSALLFDEEVDSETVTTVLEEGYGADLTDVEIEKIGRDPFLIAYVMASQADRCLVTGEVSKPSKRRANRHIPDVCDSLGVPWISNFDLLDVHNFTTSWKPAA